MSEESKFEESSGNVFLDIGFSQEEAERELLRSNLALKVYQLLEEHKLTPIDGEKLFGINQSDVARIQNGNFEDFSVEYLFTLLNKLNQNIEIYISPSENTVGYQRIVVT